jgi:large subunit ribosomal protein L28
MSKKCELLGVGIMSGNSVSHSNRKTKRRFLPNLKNIAFKSNVLGVNLKLKIATSTLRTVNKYGNIDAFLINYRFNKLTVKAQNLRVQIKKKLIKAEKLAEVQVPFEGKLVIRESARKKLVKKS